MFLIPKNSLKLLIKLSSQRNFDITPSNIGYLKILIDKELVKLHKEINLENLKTNNKSLNYLTITTEGEIYITSIKETHRQFWIPTILSIIALISSYKEEICKIIHWLLN